MADLVQVNIRMTEAQKKELDSIIALSGFWPVFAERNLIASDIFSE